MELEGLIQKIANKRTVVMGIGNEENGDDAAGPFFASLFEDRLRKNEINPERLMVINGERAPENFTGKIRKISPEIVVLVDAAYLGKGKKVGDVEFFSFKEGDKGVNLFGGGLTTHAMPISFLVDYLLSFVKEVYVIAIHVENLEKFSKMSNEVREKVELLVDLMISILGNLCSIPKLLPLGEK